MMKLPISLTVASSLLILIVNANADMYDMDYLSGTYSWAPFKSYSLGGGQQTDAFRDLTWHTHGDLSSPSFTSANGVTLKGGASIAIGSYIKWGMTGGGYMPPSSLLGPIQAGTVTPEQIASANITPKAIDAVRDYNLSTSNVLEGLQSIVLQLRTSTIFPAGSWYTPYEIAQMGSPVVLSLNGGSILLNWDYREMTHLSYDMFSTGYTQETWSFQWDLREVGVPINDFSIQWDLFPYGNLTGLQIDQSTQFIQSVDAIPEPSSYAFVALGAAFAALRFRRGKSAVGSLNSVTE